jgi:hypothetical protein
MAPAATDLGRCRFRGPTFRLELLELTAPSAFVSGTGQPWEILAEFFQKP